MHRSIRFAAAGIALSLVLGLGACNQDSVARGRYMVEAMGCADCHTPHRMGPTGPEPDPTRHLSGHPAGLALPAAPAGDGPWLVGAAATNTAWSGPWGVSFCSNLTPDTETGLGTWTEAEFVAAMREGRHRGTGRPLLPPMPAAAIGRLSDEDLGAIFAYLRSLEPIRNRVPEPSPPLARR
ncbi:MAG: c-type cytochrome [Planctomycetota bacterium]